MKPDNLQHSTDIQSQVHANPKVVTVQWVDVHNVAGGWHDEDELKYFALNEAYRVKSVGYLIYEDEKCIVLSSRYSPKTKEYGAHYGMVERIPKKIIDEMR